MNRPDWLIVGADPRFAKVSDELKGKGYTVLHDVRDQWDKETDTIVMREKPLRLLLPIHQPAGRPAPGVLDCTDKVFAGILDSEWKTAISEVNKPLHLYLEEERFIWENARLTAEGFLASFYGTGGGAVCFCRFIVAGYGRVGKTTARLLRAAGAEVIVLARSSAQTSEALTEGFRILNFGDDCPTEEGWILINTIPSKWLDPSESFSPLRIYDLASAPGCLKPGAAHEYYRLLPALPGRIFPGEAARVLSEALCRMDS